ncbi:glycoside hydrolase family 2 TIM barrel-domain containing protein [uncultured Bacteroides sp.]|uniref:glycoside hydrolase family 2 TIM barrel-domain containing protein n=1 Tax=uncultured Bacteroides sp. TaxID=162156 RepID=UPI002AA6B738|nr:glycoside hydrolase family 2 TIM barrel-domain containing protein [uncultured Bacteroides sp.]
MNFLFTACAASGQTREKVSFDNGWMFHLGDTPEAATLTFDDSQWRKLNLPHDWSIEGSFDEKNPAGCGGGALPGGIGWYRKTFVPNAGMTGKKVFIDFDGVYMNAEVFINGISLGIRPNGYISFRYDLTPYLKAGGKNVLAVRVDNSEQPNSRWYSGSGIYRNVWLTMTDAVHVDLWGTYVTTPVANAETATVSVVTSVKNDSNATVHAEVISVLCNDKGKEVGRNVSVSVAVAPQSVEEVRQALTLSKPVLWEVENPYLYTLRTKIKVGKKIVDTYETSMGIRSFAFDAQKGFILNSKQVKIKGVCLHHDLGCLGTAFNIRALQRQLQLLKEMGCNGIRCSHNPPAPELLDLCDRMGFIVMDETFDVWRKRKTAYDYSRYFDEWHERDLTDHILRDRNHPSVFMWSIGNEVLEQWMQADADTLDIQAANLLLNKKRDSKALATDGKELSVNALLTQKLANRVKALDPTRPVTAANNEPSPDNQLFRSGALDIIGFNYHDTYFKEVPKNFPGKPFLVTEATSGLMTRGYYRMPSDSTFIWPTRWDMPFHDDSFSCSSYDNCHVPWGTTHEDTWRLVKNNDFISGMYLWTGFDYLGEPTPYWWPAHSSYFGLIDLAGFPKDIYYMYQSEWTDKKVLHVFPHWNWKAGQTVDVWAYYNQADEVELFVNGKSQGVKSKGKDQYHVSWRVTYEPGTIKVVSRKAGKVVLTREIHTAGAPAQLKLTADRTKIAADGRDLSFVTIEVLDKDGNLCPNADNLVRFKVEGAGFIAGVDNGNPVSLESFKAPQRKAFYGKCLVVLQNNGEKGTIELKAIAAGLPEAEVSVKATE